MASMGDGYEIVSMFDQQIKKVLGKSTGVYVYSLDTDSSTWVKTNIGGVLWLYERNSPPQYVFQILNRNDPSKNYRQQLHSDLKLSIKPPHVYYKTTDGSVYSIWFNDPSDCKRIYTLLQKIVSGGINRSSREPATKSPMTGSSIPLLLSAANSEHKKSQTPKETSKPDQAPMDPSVLRFQLEKIAHSTAPMPDCQFASDLEQQFRQNPAKSDAEISQLIESGFDGCCSNNDVVPEAELFRLLQISSDVPEPTHPNTHSRGKDDLAEVALSRPQLKAALLTLIEEDDEFVDTIHDAYLRCLNKRLHPK